MHFFFFTFLFHISKTAFQAPRNTLAYFHHDFKEGKPDLLKDMSGSRARVQASRDNDLKRKAPVSQQEESSSLAGRQRSMYAAQLGASLMGSHGAEFNPPSNEKSSSRFFASISSASTESDRNLTFAIPQQQQQQLAALSASNELAEFARQREAAINAEIHLRFLTARRFPNLNQSPGDLLGDLGSTRVIGNTEDIPRSVLAGLAHGRLVSDQLWSSDVAASRASVSQQGSLGTSTSPQMDGKAARLLANSYVESSRTQPQPQATMLSGQLDSLTSDYWPTSRMPNLHTQSLIPDLTSRLSRDATRSTFDSNRNAPSHRFEHPIPQGQGDDYRAEQILQFYILQQQRHQQEEELRKRNQR